MTFSEHLAQLPDLLAELQACPPATRAEIPTRLPKAKEEAKPGIYAFYLDPTAPPIYIGRTRNLLRRLREHGAGSSSHYSASFAFLRARRAAEAAGHNLKGRRRAELATDATMFKPLFDAEKVAVAAMDVRWVVITDPVTQALFEVYAALHFKTDFNSFETS